MIVPYYWSIKIYAKIVGNNTHRFV